MKFKDQELLEEAYKKVKIKKMTSKKKMVKENLENMDGYELLETWMEKNAVRYEDEQDLTNLVEVLGYRQGLREFFEDNPGAIEAIFNWISETIETNQEWKDNLRDEIEGMSEDEEETNVEIPPLDQSVK
jgi:hypothetical protein